MIENTDDILREQYQEFLKNSDSKITADQFNTAYEIVYSQIEKEVRKNSKLIEIPCLDFIGTLNEAHYKCHNCSKEEWQHKL